MFKFQKLEIYQLAKEIVKFNYRLTKDYPNEEKYALVQQMNRSAISIPSNIAEGSSRRSDKERIHFLNIAYGSLMELTCQMEISLELGYIDQSVYNEYIKLVNNLSVKMNNFIKTIA